MPVGNSVGQIERDVSPVRGWLITWPKRFAIAYLLVYVFPFPLHLLGRLFQIPVLPLDLQVMSPIIVWLGDTLFGVDATPRLNGSGDQTFFYVNLVFELSVAFVVSIVWSVAVHARKLSETGLDVVQTLARYYLATTILTYGWGKVFPLQFSTLGPDRLLQTFGDASPMGLAWTFMGASVGYQIFAGLLELAGGYLLFWRRTTLAGALVSAGVLTNVMAFNYFFDVPVKLFSTHLFLVALFIMARDLPQLAGVLGFGSPVSLHKERPFWWRPGRRAVLVPVVHLLFVGALTAANVSNNLTLVRATGVFDDPSPLSGIYRVTSFVRDGVANRGNEDSVRWVRVGLNPPFYAAVLRATGDVARMRIAINEEDGTLSFFAHEQRAPETPMFTLTKPDPDVLRLEGKFFDGAPMVVVMRKEPTDSPLTSRGFRWINEVPFSR